MLFECKAINQYGGTDYYIDKYDSLESAWNGFQQDLGPSYFVVEVWLV